MNCASLKGKTAKNRCFAELRLDFLTGKCYIIGS